MEGPERRRTPRYGFQGDLEIDWEGQVFQAFISDLSLGGAFVVARNPLHIGAVFGARLMLEQPVPLRCAVRRVVPGRGMGVEFIDLAGDARTRLEKLLSSLAES